MENTDENCEMILKIWKKIVKRFGKYRKKII
jgi:aryl-phospho-beta-D-glucosidase BglC (GH1 family)